MAVSISEPYVPRSGGAAIRRVAEAIAAGAQINRQPMRWHMQSGNGKETQ
jgi:hypothetical protein